MLIQHQNHMAVSPLVFEIQRPKVTVGPLITA